MTAPPKPRRLSCAVTDAVSFALLEGKTKAAFPGILGWAAYDVARRAVIEQRPRLAGATTNPPERTVRLLLSAARAALFLESIESGSPTLAVTIAAVATELGGRDAGARAVCDVIAERLGTAKTPTRSETLALQRLVEGLPAFIKGGSPSA